MVNRASAATDKTILLNAGNVEEKRAEIRQYFHDTYDIDESLFEILRYDETFYRRADPLRHPLIFYFGHTATLYVNKLVLARLIDARVNSTYESMFAVGVDEMSWDDLDEKHYDWPPVADVQAYRDRVRAVVDDVIQTMPLQRDRCNQRRVDSATGRESLQGGGRNSAKNVF